MTTSYNFDNLSPDDQLLAFRNSIAWLRAIRAHDSTLAGEILKSYPNHDSVVFGLSMLLGLLADALPDPDTNLYELAMQAALDSGDWPGNLKD